MHVVGASLGADETQLAVPPLVARLPAAPASATPHATSAEPILSRNPFDSVTGPLNAVPVSLPDRPGGQAAPSEPVDPYNAPPCDGVQVLIIAASPDPEWSFAALETQDGQGKEHPAPARRRHRRQDGEVHRLGPRVADERQPALPVADVQAAALRPGARRAGSAACGLGRRRAVGASATTSRTESRRSAPTEYNIDRGVVDKILENQAELMRQARIVPEQENGKVVGIRLFGVRPDTLLGTLGMENGDRLEKINGFDMASPEKALEAYARLRTADHLTVSVNRRGQEMNLDYNIK